MLDYPYIIFDIDGTLIDSGSYLGEILERTLVDEGFEEMATPEAKNKFVGVTLHEGFIDSMGMTEEECRRCTEHFDRLYKEIAPSRSRTISGIEDALKRLTAAGRTLAVATNGSTENAGFILESCGIAKYFKEIQGLTSLGAHETKADVVKRLIDILGIDDPGKAVMVGDREYDVYAGKACGIATIGILGGGVGSIEEFESAGADHIVGGPAELCGLLLD